MKDSIFPGDEGPGIARGIMIFFALYRISGGRLSSTTIKSHTLDSFFMVS
jgi:hypothetical protein